MIQDSRFYQVWGKKVKASIPAKPDAPYFLTNEYGCHILYHVLQGMCFNICIIEHMTQENLTELHVHPPIPQQRKIWSSKVLI